MHLDSKDAKALDILLEAFQKSATQNGKGAVAKDLGKMREHLPKEGGVPDETLVMHIQTILIPLLEADDPAGPPEVIKKRIREIFGSLDQGRSSQ